MSSTHVFARDLLTWADSIDRKLPWKKNTTPYKILLSEIILQQTRVEQGIPYYLKFLQLFPTINDLAQASEEEILKAWQGLGYYSRARNLHHTAKKIVAEYSGKVPSKKEELLQLKGIGEYTASAISSFAYGAPNAVVDGNVYRVIARYFGIDQDFYQSGGKKIYQELAQKALGKNDPATFNQAIMDFGALVCRPKPLCDRCNLKKLCIANKTKRTELLPVKKKKLVKRNRYFKYLIVQDNEGSLLLKKRTVKDIWQNLYDFPCLETKSERKVSDKKIKEFLTTTVKSSHQITIGKEPLTARQVLTHQIIHLQFYRISISHPFVGNKKYIQVNAKNLYKFAFPKCIDMYLKDNF